MHFSATVSLSSIIHQQPNICDSLWLGKKSHIQQTVPSLVYNLSHLWADCLELVIIFLSTVVFVILVLL